MARSRSPASHAPPRAAAWLLTTTATSSPRPTRQEGPAPGTSRTSFPFPGRPKARKDSRGTRSGGPPAPRPHSAPWSASKAGSSPPPIRSRGPSTHPVLTGAGPAGAPARFSSSPSTSGNPPRLDIAASALTSASTRAPGPEGLNASVTALPTDPVTHLCATGLATAGTCCAFVPSARPGCGGRRR